MYKIRLSKLVLCEKNLSTSRLKSCIFAKNVLLITLYILDMTTLGEKIRVVRQKKGLSQIELAENAGIYQKNISRYENDTTDPSASALKKIADALGVTTDYLLSNSDEEVKINDKELLEKFEVIQNMSGKTKEAAITLIDLVIRDYKTKQAFANSI
jgi:transcriptional regulator with XRE-family HTH domain